nr:MAG TPA: hypothetical protein [Caudoviricetes sp.]
MLLSLSLKHVVIIALKYHIVKSHFTLIHSQNIGCNFYTHPSILKNFATKFVRHSSYIVYLIVNRG